VKEAKYGFGRVTHLARAESMVAAGKEAVASMFWPVAGWEALIMSNPFFDHPILNSPYEYPMKYWELDEPGQPTQKIIDRRRSAKFITPIPKPKKRKAAAQAWATSCNVRKANRTP
jgi:hypothetical protein